MGRQGHLGHSLYENHAALTIMFIPLLISLLGTGLYAYVLAILLLTRQEPLLLCAAVCGCFLFGMAALAALKRGWKVLCALHGFVSVLATILLVALLIM